MPFKVPSNMSPCEFNIGLCANIFPCDQAFKEVRYGLPTLPSQQHAQTRHH